MFNKVVNKDKMYMIMKENKNVIMTNSKGKKIGEIFYDDLLLRQGYMYFLQGDRNIIYIDMDHILMYDKSKNEIIITF